MAERVCKTCGAPKDEGATFCGVCDTYLGWAVTTEVPVVTPAGTNPPPPPPAPPPPTPTPTSPLPTAGPPAAAPPGPAATPPGPAPARAEQRPQQLLPPAATVRQTEVVVAPQAPGELEISVKNDSTIVESYVVELAEPLDWLSLTHDDTHLLPDTVGSTRVTLAVPPGVLAVAQRVRVPLRIRSAVDPARSTPLAVDVVVPPTGPDASVTARPHLVRLEDTTTGGFEVLLDNRQANFTQRYELTATDPEAVVVVEFTPAVVEVPAGGTATATARLTAPAPPPGQQLSRQLTVTAVGADGRDGAVAVPVTIAQITAAPPESLPVRLRLEPATVALVGTGSTRIQVVFDNRGGHESAKFTLAGRDPAGRVGFRFDHGRVAVPAGSLGYVGAVLETPPVAPGASESRPFSVVAVADDGRETEAPGVLELSAAPDPITTARVLVQPEHLVTQGRKGVFVVDVDNRQGAEPLHVQLSGSDEFGRARLAFQPTVLLVPPGQVARAGLTVQCDRPAAGTSSSRRVQVRATSHTGSVAGEATFTQRADDNRRLWAILLVLLGVCLLLAGTALSAAQPALDRNVLDVVARSLVSAAQDNRAPDVGDVLTAGGAGLLGLQLLCAVLMLLGLTGGGRLVRTAAIVALLCGLGVTATTGVVVGLPFVLAGAVAAFAGGVLLRR